MKESQFQKQVKKQLESQGAFIINIHGHGMQKVGLPDLLVLHPRWTGFLELKTEKGKCSAIQCIIATKIELRGTPIYVLRCVEVNTEVFIYQLENFKEKIIKETNNLQKLLDILVLEKECGNLISDNRKRKLKMTTRKICKKCGRENPIGFSVPDEVWQQVIPLCRQNDVICIYCFITMADILSVEWDKNIKLYPVSLVSSRKKK